jgi:hypothetical protein
MIIIFLQKYAMINTIIVLKNECNVNKIAIKGICFINNIYFINKNQFKLYYIKYIR